MAQSEQSAAHANMPQEGSASKGSRYPLIVGLIAVAFAANAWFFYHQGQQDGVNVGSTATPIATPIVSPEGTSPIPQATTDNAAATTAETPQPAMTGEAGKSAALATGDKPALQAVAKTKTTNRLVAKATKPVSAGDAKIHDRQAALLRRPNPAYPVQALRAHEQGTVLVLAQVDVNGRVSDARIARHSGSKTLDRAATAEVRRWKFEPALHDGRPVVASVEVPVSYRLGD